MAPSTIPPSQACKEAEEAGHSPYEREAPGSSTHPCPEAGACTAAPVPKGGETGSAPGHSAGGVGQRGIRRRSAEKCCISHKGGSQRALLGETRGTGNAEPSFNAHLIFMELQQHQPRCREHSPSTEGERQFPTNSL